MYDRIDLRNVKHPVAIIKNSKIVTCSESFARMVGENVEEILKRNDVAVLPLRNGYGLAIYIPLFWKVFERYLELEVGREKTERLMKIFSAITDITSQIGKTSVSRAVCMALGMRGIFECVFSDSVKLFKKCYECGEACRPKKFSFGNGNVTIGGQMSREEEELLSALAEILSTAHRGVRLEVDKMKLMDVLAKNLEHFDFLSDRLRNPLAIIKGFLEIRSELDEKHFFDTIEKQVERMEKILDELGEAETRTYELIKKEQNRRN